MDTKSFASRPNEEFHKTLEGVLASTRDLEELFASKQRTEFHDWFQFALFEFRKLVESDQILYAGHWLGGIIKEVETNTKPISGPPDEDSEKFITSILHNLAFIWHNVAAAYFAHQSVQNHEKCAWQNDKLNKIVERKMKQRKT